jgi:hypothetical protein
MLSGLNSKGIFIQILIVDWGFIKFWGDQDKRWSKEAMDDLKI